MKFGIFVLPSWPQREPSHQSRIFHEMVEHIQYAEELEFQSVWLGEHHFTRFGIVPSALPLATYVAGRTKKIRIGTGVSVLNFHDPVFMAEETAMVDLLSDGRLDFGIGRSQVVYEYANFKVDYETRTQRFSKIVDIILGLWSTSGFTYPVEHYQVDDLTIAPTPDEDDLGLRDLYAGRCAEAMNQGDDLNGDLRTLTGGSEICADLHHWVKTRPEDPPSHESRLNSTAYFGTPDRQVERIKGLRDQHHVQYFTAHFPYGGLEHAKVIRSIELFAKEVMPRFR